jgi:hypothetical protein
MILKHSLAGPICALSLGMVCLHAEDRAQPQDPYAAHLQQLPMSEGFTVMIEPPFVVLGNEAPETVRRRATNTVRWAVQKLKQDYFVLDPAEIIDIWLFRDRQSYTNHAWQLFHQTPSSPFGYYSEEKHALVMNIQTGGGTLIHEIVHPFVHANFPRCPAWFNEGLASLYEASTEKNGHIWGTINWRFKGLEKAIQEKRVISFEELTSKADGFYAGDTYSQFYAQARYLCFYLQEKQLLIQFYKRFQRNASRDPTGLDTLQAVLGETDMKAFQKKWEKFVLGLRL